MCRGILCLLINILLILLSLRVSYYFLSSDENKLTIHKYYSLNDSILVIVEEKQMTRVHFQEYNGFHENHESLK